MSCENNQHNFTITIKFETNVPYSSPVYEPILALDEEEVIVFDEVSE